MLIYVLCVRSSYDGRYDSPYMVYPASRVVVASWVVNLVMVGGGDENVDEDRDTDGSVNVDENGNVDER